jgi:hypothetical protein
MKHIIFIIFGAVTVMCLALAMATSPSPEEKVNSGRRKVRQGRSRR